MGEGKKFQSPQANHFDVPESQVQLNANLYHGVDSNTKQGLESAKQI